MNTTPLPNTNHRTTLVIEGMEGELCIQKVAAALATVPALTVHSVSVGSAVVAGDQSVCNAACIAVDDAGYPCRDASTITAPTDIADKEGATKR
jgi:copper chaperone CopZ